MQDAVAQPCSNLKLSSGSDAVWQPTPCAANAEVQSLPRDSPKLSGGSDAGQQPNLQALRIAPAPEGGATPKQSSSSPKSASLLHAIETFDSLPDVAVSRSPHAVRDKVQKSFYSGMYRRGPLVGLRSSVAQFPEAVKVFTRLIAEVSPTHQFSSFVILEGSEMGIHRDAQNACLPNLVIPLTRFEGGELAVADPEGQVVSHGGQSFRARLCDLGRGPIAFNAQGLQHAVMPFKGRRLVLIAYCLKNVASLDRASCRALRALGFRLLKSNCLPACAAFSGWFLVGNEGMSSTLYHPLRGIYIYRERERKRALAPSLPTKNQGSSSVCLHARLGGRIRFKETAKTCMCKKICMGISLQTAFKGFRPQGLMTSQKRNPKPQNPTP